MAGGSAAALRRRGSSDPPRCGDIGLRPSSSRMISREHRERRSAPLATRDEAVRGCARASIERGEAPGWQGASRGAWRSHSLKKQRRSEAIQHGCSAPRMPPGCTCGPQGPIAAALLGRGATQSESTRMGIVNHGLHNVNQTLQFGEMSEAVQRGCSAARMPWEVCLRAASVRRRVEPE